VIGIVDLSRWRCLDALLALGHQRDLVAVRIGEAGSGDPGAAISRPTMLRARRRQRAARRFIFRTEVHVMAVCDAAASCQWS